jgi:anthranilate synthase component 1
MPPREADCLLVLPGTVLLFDHVYNRLCRIRLGAFSKGVGVTSAARAARHGHDGQGETVSDPDEAGYKDHVVRIKEMLRRGEAIQVVPSVRFSTAFFGDSFTLYRRMRRCNASPYMFYMRFPGLTLLGSSPEIMVRCVEGQLQLSPIAGTRRRGKDDMEDALLAAELREDPKERSEHVMLVDLGRNDLGRVARPGSVNLERYMEVERFSHVMHLTSRVTARLAEGLDALDVLAATFPAGTVSGAPKVRAMEIIRELEGRPRGPYAGCIGWIGLDGESVNLDMGITIRSMWVRGDELFWQAGGGIVHDSDPDLEWKEVCDKSAIMRMAVHAEDEEYVPDNR